MNNEEVKKYLQHVLESIDEIEQYTKGVSKEDFFGNREKQNAVIRMIEIIGEAVKNLPLSFRKEHLYVDWDSIAGMRDVLIHQYFGVDLNVVWDTVTNDIPKLREEAKQILQEDLMRN